MSVCKSCDASVRWVKTEAGRMLPVDLFPTPTGNVQVRAGIAHVLRKLEDPSPGLPRFSSHFETCPGAAAHRRAKQEKAAKQGSLFPTDKEPKK